MTYEEFERVGFECGVPFVLLKLAWGSVDYARYPFDERALRAACHAMLAACPADCLTGLRQYSGELIDASVLDPLAKELRRVLSERRAASGGA